ncbi:hypothetical protein KKC63_00435 [Patescibacteria group bacterium]|nr:hypothetical protein [Patescibacteria group bacterium]MBU4022982.1 hypothetical protein [Patescibacteria group bacterium]MBU4078077.1 hypothetical protein [Patescibacteria group bacterium]
MKGEWLKICILLIIVLSFFPWSAIKGQLEPPSIQTGKDILNRTGSTTKSFLTGIGQGIGDLFNSIVPSIRNGDEIISNWWKEKAKPWVSDLWENIKIYLSQEIIID